MQILNFPLGEKLKEAELRKSRYTFRLDRTLASEKAEIIRYEDIAANMTGRSLIKIHSPKKETAYIWKVKHGSSFYGLPILDKPYASAEWYASRIYFANKFELIDFLANRYKLTLMEYKGVCPLCGSPMMNQLRYVFADGSGLPFDMHFCSHECLSYFMRRLDVTAKVFEKFKTEQAERGIR